MCIFKSKGYWKFITNDMSNHMISKMSNGPQFPKYPKDGKEFYLTHEGKKRGKYVWCETQEVVSIPKELLMDLITSAKYARSNEDMEFMPNILVKINNTIQQAEELCNLSGISDFTFTTTETGRS